MHHLNSPDVSGVPSHGHLGYGHERPAKRILAASHAKHLPAVAPERDAETNPHTFLVFSRATFELQRLVGHLRPARLTAGLPTSAGRPWAPPERLAGLQVEVSVDEISPECEVVCVGREHRRGGCGHGTHDIAGWQGEGAAGRGCSCRGPNGIEGRRQG